MSPSLFAPSQLMEMLLIRNVIYVRFQRFSQNLLHNYLHTAIVMFLLHLHMVFWSSTSISRISFLNDRNQ